MSDRPSNGEYKYQREENTDSKGRGSSEKERDEKEHQVDKAGEYVRELLQEKVELDSQKWPNATRLIDQEIQKTQAIGKPVRDPKYVDIYREKPIRVSVKVLVPIREHPKFNFVGKLLGPKGNSMKRLQEETMCKMAVLGRGSMKDRQKEEECRMSLDPKYAHLSDDLHVEITALAPPAEAYARIAFALAEVRKYLIPDNNDNIRQEQMREMEMSMADDHTSGDDRRPSVRGVPGGGILRPSARPSMPRSSRTAILPPPSSRGPLSRPVSAKSKVFSILDRARVAMDQSYGYETATPPPSNRVGSHHDYDYHTSTSSSSRYGDRHYPSTSGRPSKTHIIAVRKDAEGKKIRRMCVSCYEKRRRSLDRIQAKKNVKKPMTYCPSCPTNPQLCLDCFAEYHSELIDDMYPSSRYTTYEYEDDAVPHSSHDYYETSEYPEESSSRAWKSYKTTTTSGSSSRYRNAPYSRPSK